MHKRARRLILNRETLRHLDDPALRTPGAGDVAPISPWPGCMSPLCPPSAWETCECRGELA